MCTLREPRYKINIKYKNIKIQKSKKYTKIQINIFNVHKFQQRSKVRKEGRGCVHCSSVGLLMIRGSKTAFVGKADLANVAATNRSHKW